MNRRTGVTRSKFILLRVMLALLVWSVPAVPVLGQGTDPAPVGGAQAEAKALSAPTRVEVKPAANDSEISKRLQSVLAATGWFTDSRVSVREGVVFLNGQTTSDELKKWAGDLARNTEGVVAVANRIEVVEPSVWDYGRSGLTILWRDIVKAMPLLLFGLVILTASVGVGVLATRLARAGLATRIHARLLRNVIAVAAGTLVVLIGIYIVLRVSGLTQLALTVVGGTGLVGLAVGIAFRDITENFLASIFLSMQQPFETGDLVEIAGVTGYVQQLNLRTTVLMTLEGFLVQIPNATVYKTNLRNFSTNCNRREDFVVGIGYDDNISEAQEIAHKVLAEHPAVLNAPEPSVLADSLGKATVNLRVYFWLNGREHSWLKVRSSVIRLVKRAFQAHGISMPDEAREVVFPNGIPVTLRNAGEGEAGAPSETTTAKASPESGGVSTEAEAGLYSEDGIIEEQARQVQPLREQENLLKRPAAGAGS